MRFKLLMYLPTYIIYYLNISLFEYLLISVIQIVLSCELYTSTNTNLSVSSLLKTRKFYLFHNSCTTEWIIMPKITI